MYKQYIGIVRDHSVSMSGLRNPAMNDYNQVVDALKQSSAQYNVDTIVSVSECGYERLAQARLVINNSSLQALAPMVVYPTNASGTPLFDAVMLIINSFKTVPDYNDPNTAFLVSVITDGQENSSKINKQVFTNTLKELQGTDRWTFTFRVPYGYKGALIGFGIPEHNIIEWEQTQKGFEHATIMTTSSFNDFYQTRSVGQTSTRKFYANVGDIKVEDIKVALKDISSEVTIFEVDRRTEIRPFFENKNINYIKGTAFYQLLKTETIQPTKNLIIRRKSTGEVFAGSAARSILNLSSYGNIRVSPGYFGEYELYVQSTSVNRILGPGSKVLYYPRALNAAA